MKRALQYIARTEEFHIALTSQRLLKVCAVYEDGSVSFTELAGAMNCVSHLRDNIWLVQTDTMKNGKTLTLHLI